jgi:hypothetical protein
MQRGKCHARNTLSLLNKKDLVKAKKLDKNTDTV